MLELPGQGASRTVVHFPAGCRQRARGAVPQLQGQGPRHRAVHEQGWRQVHAPPQNGKGKGNGWGKGTGKGFSAFDENWPLAGFWPDTAGQWPSAAPAYGAQPPGPPPAPWLMASTAPAFDPWSQWPTAAAGPQWQTAAAGFQSVAGQPRSLSSLVHAPAAAPVPTHNRYAVLSDWPTGTAEEG